MRQATPSCYRPGVKAALVRARTLVSAWTRRFGFDVTRFDRGKLIAHQISVVFDVGANLGQYAAELRAVGYRGRIISCEPLGNALPRLAQRAAAEIPAGWPCTARSGRATAAGPSTSPPTRQSSSLLEMMPRARGGRPPRHLPGGRGGAGLPPGRHLGPQHVRADDRVFLKLDVQGYERMVLAGAQASLPRLQGVQLEMSLVPLYRGEAHYTDLIAQMTGHGFQLMSVEPAFRDPHSGQLLAMDGIFFRS